MNEKYRKRALITGITGQDGILLADFLMEKGYDVFGFARHESIVSRMDLRNLFDRIVVVSGDLGDPADIIDAIQHLQPDEVYNLASQSAPGRSWLHSVETGEITGMAVHRLLEAVRRFKPDCRVYQASSSEMFGEVLESPQNEDTPFNPSNPYAAAKVYAHYLSKIYRRSYKMFVACGILFNHESPYRGMNFLTQKVTYGAACAKLGIDDSSALNEEGDPIVQGGKLRLGNLNSARDWGHAKDYVRAIWMILQHDAPDDYVIGTGQLRTVRDLCAMAYGYVGKSWESYVETDPRFVRPTDTGPTVADASKAKLELGWQPTISFEDMIAEMVDAHVLRLSCMSSESRP